MLSLLNAIFLHRYQTVFNINAHYITLFLLYFNFSFLLLLLSTLKYNDIINPLALYSIFTFCYAFSCLPLSERQMSSSNTAHIVIFLSILSYVVGVLLYKKITFKSIFLISLRSKRRILLLLVLLSLACFILEILILGYIPMFHYFDKRNIYGEIAGGAIPFLHYFVMLSTILPSWAYIYYKHSAITRSTCITIFIITLCILCNSPSRLEMLLFSVSTFLTFNYYFRFSLSKKITFGLLFIIIFLLVGAIRISQISEVGQSDYMRAYGNIEYETNLVESVLVSYSSLPFSRFDTLVEQDEIKDNFHFGKYILRPLFSIFFLEKLGIIQYEPDTQSLVLTYAIDPYLDFSFFGTILFNLSFGFYSMHIFRRYDNFNEDSIITWAIIIFCLIMTPFVNFVNTFFIWFFWSTNQILTPFNPPEMPKRMSRAVNEVRCDYA